MKSWIKFLWVILCFLNLFFIDSLNDKGISIFICVSCIVIYFLVFITEILLEIKSKLI